VTAWSSAATIPPGANSSTPLTRHPLGACRVAREVATERDLFNAHGSFYELPARNAGGFAKLRPIATHNRRVHDYCSYRGLFIVSGIATDAPRDNPHVIHSDDAFSAYWIRFRSTTPCTATAQLEYR